MDYNTIGWINKDKNNLLLKDYPIAMCLGLTFGLNINTLY